MSVSSSKLMVTNNRKYYSRHRLRLVAKWTALAASVVLSTDLWHASWPALPLAAFSPYVIAGSALTARSVGVLALLGIPVLVFAIISRRCFCRCACPTGFLLKLTAKLRPGPSFGCKRTSPIGHWLALATLAGATVGYPLLLWMDPLAIFNGFFSVWPQPVTLAAVCSGLALPTLLLVELWQPRFWCTRLCPLGGIQDLLASIRKHRPPPARNLVLGRRGFLAVCAGIAGGLAIGRVRGQTPPLRPPGSLDENQFTGVCVRCGNCIRVCPTKILRPDLGSYGWAGVLTPVMQFDQGYCREECNRCNQSCPSGAIQRLPLAEKRRRVIGVACVNLEICLLADGRECTLCIRACPFEALSVFTDGFDSRPQLELSKCTGCGACELWCPVRPERAIRVFRDRTIP